MYDVCVKAETLLHHNLYTRAKLKSINNFSLKLLLNSIDSKHSSIETDYVTSEIYGDISFIKYASCYYSFGKRIFYSFHYPNVISF